MSKRTASSSKTTAIAPIVYSVDPNECPFREFRDNELQPEFWGMGPAAFRAHSAVAKQTGPKLPQDQIWVDDQTQPLPRSVRQYLDGWIRAEELAETRWDAEVMIFEEANNGDKMSVADIQLSHAQVLLRSSFCREVLSACFMLEKTDLVSIEHQWENFTCTLGPEGWRAKYHIYSPGLKPGGGTQHRPIFSKNGCYLVRLYHLGAWRCVWVSDQVPVDATGAPLLPFSPLLSKAPASKPGAKQAPATVTAPVVYLWPLLLCKALLKLAVPDLNPDELTECLEDEKMPEFNILHALTGAFDMDYKVTDEQSLWELITKEVPVFSWDDDDETQGSTLKSRSTKKPLGKETATLKSKGSFYVILRETKEIPAYCLPGITPAFEMSLLVTMARDLPLKKPLPEPEVALWKCYRWVDWARSHGLYEAYDCPRTRFLKVNGLMKLSYAPHLLDVQSTESITVGFVKAEHSKTPAAVRSKIKDTKPPIATNSPQQLKEELREWIKYESIYDLIKVAHILYYPSMFQATSAASNPTFRITKVPLHKALDIQAPKSAPLYLQIDGPETNTLRISLNMLHPRILANSGVLIEDHVESAYLVLENFEWFKDSILPQPKAFVKTCGYNSVEVKFKPGRHFCRIWVHSRLNWHMMLISESTLLLGPRDQIQCAAVRECPWASKFLLALGSAFANWLRINRSNHFLPSVQMADKEFFRHYNPDLPWNNEIIGYDRAFRHWMFRQALQAHLSERLLPADKSGTFMVLRKYFCDPNFGFPLASLPPASLKAIAENDPCDCVIPEAEQTEMFEEQEEIIEETQVVEEIPVVNPSIINQLLITPKPPIMSHICEFVTEELPCGVLKKERYKVIRKHEAATIIQAHWRGMWARKCLNDRVVVSPEVMRALQDTTYGSQEALMCLMNVFFRMYPGTKYAYSVASALSGTYGLHQYHGTSPVTSKCKWIPYFQGVFFCHGPVKVHFDVMSSLYHSIVAVYNNDTGVKLPQAYNAHKTFDFSPNTHGYTVMGHGSLKEASGINIDVQWQFTVLSSTEGAFHICDNEEICREIQLNPAGKIHIEEMFLPNRRNILGGIHLSVTKYESVGFGAKATSPDLEIVATLRTMTSDGITEEIATCSGIGEIFWPYIKLEPSQPKDPLSAATLSTPALNMGSLRALTKGNKSKPLSGRSQKSATKIKSYTPDPKYYSIEVTAPSGWPLTIDQWRRVDEVRNSQEFLKLEGTAKKASNIKEKVVIKSGSVKDKTSDKRPLSPPIQQPQPGDAYVELECSFSVGGGIVARRDDERDLQFAAAIKSWDENEPGRNQRGAEIRKYFRDENLEVPPTQESIPSTTTDLTTLYEGEGEYIEEYFQKQELQIHGPSPATESMLMEMSGECEEELKYCEMPEQLRDKFTPLSFLPLCTMQLVEDECILVSCDMAEAAKKDRHARFEAAQERMRDLQEFNEIHVLCRQRNRCQLLEKLNVDSRWSEGLLKALEGRDDAIAQETLLRAHSASKKKQEVKSKK